MENDVITREELHESIRNSLKSAKLYDLKWMYSYFNEFDKFPIIIDEAPPREDTVYNVWAEAEEK